jgi:hypothetical protein
MKRNILLSLLLLGSVAVDAAKRAGKRPSKKERNSLIGDPDVLAVTRKCTQKEVDQAIRLFTISMTSFSGSKRKEYGRFLKSIEKQPELALRFSEDRRQFFAFHGNKHISFACKRMKKEKEKSSCSLFSILCGAVAATFVADACHRMVQTQGSRPVFNQDTLMISVDPEFSDFLGVAYPNGTMVFNGSDFDMLNMRDNFMFIHEDVTNFALKVGDTKELGTLAHMYNCAYNVSSPVELVPALTECRKLFVRDSVDVLESVVQPTESEITMAKLDEYEEMMNATSANYCFVKDGVPVCEYNPLVIGLTDVGTVYENRCVIEDDKIVCYEAKK